MRLQITITLTVCLLCGYGLTAQTRSSEALLKAAQHKEHVEGDLKAAIEQYQQLIERRDIARPVAAEALLGLARSYEKQGAAEARAIYERILRDYADQAAVIAVARERVGTLGTSSAPRFAARQLLQLPNRIAVLTLLSDGRLGGTDWNTGDLVLADPSTGTISPVVSGDINKTTGTWAEDPLLSPDRRQLAYQWFGSDPKEQKGSLRILPMERGAKSRILVADPENITNIFPLAWTQDASSLLVSYEKPVPAGAGRQPGQGDFALAWVSTATGVVKPFKTFEWWRSGTGNFNSIGKVSLSPDGRWIAYAVRDRQGAPDMSVFVIGADGSAERRLVSGGVNDQPLWTPDSARIVFLSNRSGDAALWSVALSEGRQGSPTIIKNGMGRVILHGMLPSGMLVYEEMGLDPLMIAEFDRPLAATGTPSLRVVDELNGQVPAWSLDGKYLAYKRRTTNPGRAVELVVRSSETGESLTYSPREGNMGTGQPAWYGDGTVQAVTRSGVRVRVGDTLEEITAAARLPLGPLSADGRTLYAGTPEGTIDVFDVTSGTRSTSISLSKNWRPAGVSPDGRLLALVARDNESPLKLAVVGVDGSGFRALPASSAPLAGLQARNPVVWMRDGRALFVAVSTGRDMASIQRVPINGGAPVTIAANIGEVRSFDISPDERRIAYSLNRPTTDVWMLDLKAALK